MGTYSVELRLEREEICKQSLEDETEEEHWMRIKATQSDSPARTSGEHKWRESLL